MAVRLPRFTSGRPLTDEVTSDKLNQLVDAIRQCELNSGVGYDVNRGPGGTTLTVRPVVLPQGTGAAKDLIGPSNSGISHTDASVVVNPGVESYNFQSKTPTGSYSTAFVHGSTWSNFITYNTGNNKGLVTAERKRIFFSSQVALSSNDLYRRIGLQISHQGDVFNFTANNVTGHASPCDAVTSGDYRANNNTSFVGTCNAASDISGSFASTLSLYSAGTGTGQVVCSGTTYYVSATCSGRYAGLYYTFTNVGSAPGNFGDGGEPILPTGNYSYKRTFDIGSIPASSVKVRVKIRIGLGTFFSVKLNGQNATYTTFEAQTSTFVPIEITDGFISGENQLEVVITSTSTTIYPSVSFEFLPTTATIVTTQGFSILTDAQKDLIGNGTPVQVTVGTTSSLYAYDGAGDKGTTASYTFLRDVNPAP